MVEECDDRMLFAQGWDDHREVCNIGSRRESTVDLAVPCSVSNRSRAPKYRKKNFPITLSKSLNLYTR